MLVFLFVLILTVNCLYFLFRQDKFYEAFICCYFFFIIVHFSQLNRIELSVWQLALAMTFFVFYSFGNAIYIFYSQKQNAQQLLGKVRHYLALAACVGTLSTLFDFWQADVIFRGQLELTILTYINLILFVLFCLLLPKLKFRSDQT